MLKILQRRNYFPRLALRSRGDTGGGAATLDAPRPSARSSVRDSRSATPQPGLRDTLSGGELDRAIGRCQDYFRRTQYPEGYWWAELESNNTMEAEYLLLSHFLGRVDPERWRKMTAHILQRQRADGSWGQYYEAPGDLSTSVECYFALKLAGLSPDSEPLRKAQRFILAQGGVPKARIFTKIWLALFGQWDWKALPNMPPEMIFLPPWVPFNIYDFSSWARATIVPLLVVFARRPVCPLPQGMSLGELYPEGQGPVDGSLPCPASGWGWARLFHRLDQLAGLYQASPVHPFRGLAERRVVEWIASRQEADGSWSGIQPPWVYSLIALHVMGFPPEHPVMEKGWRGFDAGYIIEGQDTCSLQGCISPVWDTCLAQIALAESGVSPSEPMLQRSNRWLLGKQVTTGGDWQVRAGTTSPGGWAFEFHNNCYPDIDDTAEVVMALTLVPISPEQRLGKEQAIARATAWLLGMQSKNGAWASFDKDNTRRYVSKIPFCDFGEMLDPPSADVTAHVLEMFGRLGYSRDFPPLQRAYQYLRQEQEADGSWFGRWGVNYVYGLGAVLPALESIGEDMSQPYLRRAVAWLVRHQNSDGGWGESCVSYVNPEQGGCGPSTPSQTAWALLALLAAGEADHPAALRGARYLVETQAGDGSWDEPWFTGTGFPGYGVGERVKRPPKPGERGYQGADMSAGFMINYHMYRNCWPLLALGRYRRLAERGVNAQDAPARLYPRLN
ncbi:MAG: squalene--hopene cyclase [Dehalococcoidia bacterium]|nr:squalene--hopene cyclase [Dehalococcoidia bacterium]MSQ17581.1 squalene--hopene cyclase [Dehalococcoidia bacterium]